MLLGFKNELPPTLAKIWLLKNVLNIIFALSVENPQLQEPIAFDSVTSATDLTRSFEGRRFRNFVFVKLERGNV